MNILSTILHKIFHPSHASAETQAAASPAPQNETHIDVNAVLSGLAEAKHEKLNWQSSIVDLLKLLDRDSSLASRKQLAHELNYTGDYSDSATMNQWLSKEVLKKFAENGGKIPDSMKH